MPLEAEFDVAIICPDVDVEKTAQAAMMAAFKNSG